MKRTFSSCAGVKGSPVFVGDRGLDVLLYVCILGAEELVILLKSLASQSQYEA